MHMMFPRFPVPPFPPMEIWSRVFQSRRFHPANGHLLAVPRFQLNTYGRRAFSVAGPMAWNSLPDFIWDPANSTDCFRRLNVLVGALLVHPAH